MIFSFLYLSTTTCFSFFYQHFWTQACPEGIGTNGTHRSHARCHPYPIPQPAEVGHATEVYVLYSFRTVMLVLLRPTWTDQWKCCETGPTVFWSLSEKSRMSNHLQMSLQRQHFLLSYLKTVSVGPAGVWTRDLPLAQTGALPTVQIHTQLILPKSIVLNFSWIT